MILIIGGIGQGKRSFARQQAARRKGGAASESISFVDGSSASWEEFLNAEYGCNLHLMIRRRLQENKWMGMEQQLLKTCPDRILITDEIGAGIVPVDAFEREYRELTGRICCKLAAEAKEVWRVTAGIGIKIK